MAVKLDGQLGKTDVLHLNPYKLILNDGENTRWAPVSDAAVFDMALSLIHDGQKQPIRIRKLDGKGATARHGVMSGFTRTRAALLINEDPDMRAEAKLGEDEVFTIQAIKVTANADDALIENIVENIQRNELSYMDKAKIFNKLRERGWNDTEIAKKCKTPQPKIGQIIDFLTLSPDIQERIHQGHLSWDAANHLILIPEEDRQEVIDRVDREMEEKFAAEEAAIQAALVANEATEAETEEETVAETGEVTTVEGDDPTQTSAAARNKTAAKPKKAKSKKVAVPKAKTEAQKEREKKAALTRASKDKAREVTGNASGAKKIKRTVKDMRDFLDQATSSDVGYGDEDAQIKHMLSTVLEWIDGTSTDEQFLESVADFFQN